MRLSILLSVSFGVLVCAVMQLAAEPVVALFTDGTTAEGTAVVRLGRQYLRGYVWDCIFAGVHFCFSGYFCAAGKSGLSFLHNIIAIALVRIPGAMLTSRMFPDTLLPMGLATACGSLVSVLICGIAFSALRRREHTTGEGMTHGT